MPVETPVNGIWDLDQNNPLTTDTRRQGDDHLRLIKDAIKLTFPQVNAVINATDEDLNILAGVIAAGLTQTELLYLDGVTSSIQDQLDDPTIMRTDQANVITGGALSLINQIITSDFDNATSNTNHFLMRNIAGIFQWLFTLYANNDVTRPNALSFTNAIGQSKLILRQDGQLLEGTDTDLNWGGNPVALQSGVDASAKNDDFNFHPETFTTGNGFQSGTIVTPYGNDDFIWGLMGARRSDDAAAFALSSYKCKGAGGAGRTLQNFQGGLETDISGIVDPGFPAFPVNGAGQITYTFRGEEADNRGWTLTFWSRRNI